jgi:DNA-binding transcriptional regulator GbsR (MarR family)
MEGQKPDNPFENLGGKEGTSSNPRQPVPNELREHIKELAIKGLSLGEIAKKVNRSKSTVSRIVKTLKLSKSITLVKAGRILEHKLNAAETLYKIHQKAFQIIDKLTIKDKESANEYGFIVLKACDAVRKMLETQLRIWEALYRVEEITRWQNDVMDTLAEELPDARERFYRRLQERRPV